MPSTSRRTGRYVPAVVKAPHAFPFATALRDSLRSYSWSHLRADLMAGVVVGIVALPLSMALVGLFLGWQAATAVALMTGVLRLAGAVGALAWLGLSRVPSTGYVLAATLTHLVTWRGQDAMPLWPGTDTSPIVLACVCVAGAIAARWSFPRRLAAAA